MPRTSRQTSRASLVAALGLSAVPIAGAIMQYTSDSAPAVVAEAGAQISAGRSSGGFMSAVNAADTVADAAIAQAAIEAAEAFANAGPAATEFVQVGTSESTRNIASPADDS